MSYAKPMVTIELQEYNHLKAAEQKACKLLEEFGQLFKEFAENEYGLNERFQAYLKHKGHNLDHGNN